MLQTIIKIVLAEFKIDFRNLGTWIGILLFLLSCSYITFLLFSEVEAVIWLALVWFIILFSALQSFYTSFRRELIEKPLYYYTLYSAHEALFAKLLYHILRILILVVLTTLALWLFHGYPINHTGVFMASLGLGALLLSAVFTLTSAISSRSDQSSALLSVISLPLMIPFLMGVITLSYKSVQTEVPKIGGDVTLLIALLLLVIALSIFLFPLIWRD